MRKFLPFSRRQPSLDRHAVHRGGWPGSDRSNGKSMRRISATSLNTRSIQVVRGAYNIDLNKVDSSFTKLHRACLMNDDAQVRKHLHKVDTNSHDASNRYPIHLATVNGNFAIVKLLIENQANPNVKDNEDNTPLIKSIECGHEHLVKYLLNNGADPNLSDSNNNTALHWAIMTESIIAIDALMSSNKCNLSLRNNKDETYLHLAVRSPLINTSTFESMLKDCSDLEAKDQLGLTPVDIAQACNNKIAMSAFERFRISNQRSDANSSTNNSSDNQYFNDNQANAKKICEDYKLKYMTKNRENLEFEKRLIQLTAQIERMKLDMSYMKERNDKLESDCEKILAENSKLKAENENLLEQLNKTNILMGEKEEKQTEQGKKEPNRPAASEQSPVRDETGTSNDKDNDLGEIGTVESIRHEEFLVTRACLQERINKLTIGLTTEYNATLNCLK